MLKSTTIKNIYTHLKLKNNINKDCHCIIQPPNIIKCNKHNKPSKPNILNTQLHSTQFHTYSSLSHISQYSPDGTNYVNQNITPDSDNSLQN